ncbi:hypothetical protein K9L05_04015 [Candidatus Babeliales bacterium]|nr:hypothetical protein [Candidatus Babeliales bacterium]MCF7899782.1 hypothetical protein [Candidatus Babeliales bacterium]
MKIIKISTLGIILFSIIFINNLFGMFEFEEFTPTMRTTQIDMLQVIYNHEISVDAIGFPIDISNFALSDECYEVEAKELVNQFKHDYPNANSSDKPGLESYARIISIDINKFLKTGGTSEDFDNIKLILTPARLLPTENFNYKQFSAKEMLWMSQNNSRVSKEEARNMLRISPLGEPDGAYEGDEFIYEFVKKCEDLFIMEVIKKVGCYFGNGLSEEITKGFECVSKDEFEHDYEAIFPNKTIIYFLHLAVAFKFAKQILSSMLDPEDFEIFELGIQLSCNSRLQKFCGDPYDKFNVQS